MYKREAQAIASNMITDLDGTGVWYEDCFMLAPMPDYAPRVSMNAHVNVTRDPFQNLYRCTIAGVTHTGFTARNAYMSTLAIVKGKIEYMAKVVHIIEAKDNA